MEGICGIISFGESLPNRHGKMERMANSLSDGEPLNISTIGGPNWALACAGWKEPFWPSITFCYQDGDLALAGIADILNLQELAARYKVRAGDCGTVLAACHQADEAGWPLFVRGNFALVIYNDRQKRLTAVTDRVGIRPLVWRREGQCYYFSSRLDAIKQASNGLEINPTAVYAYLHHSMIPSPYTIYKDTHKLEPGFVLTADSARCKVKRYWDLSIAPKTLEPESAIATMVYDRIQSAVVSSRDGVASEAELGCFLSGGTDSSSICGLLSRQSIAPVAAYSIGFPENGYDEMLYARIAAQAYKLAHRELYVHPHDVLELLPPVVAAYDEPFANSSALPAFSCARLAMQEGRHYLIAGDGGDEIFGGNERYATQQLFRNYFKIPGFIRAGVLEPLLLDRLEKVPLPLFHKAGSYIRRAKLSDVERLASYRYVTDEEMFAPEFLAQVDREEVHAINRAHFDRLDDAAPLDRHLYLDMKITITDNDLRKVTRMCELAHVRVRYPMLDHPVIELGFRIPAPLKLKGTNGLRYIFKQAFRDLLPKEILAKSKHGFGLPISQWLRNDPMVRRMGQDLLLRPGRSQRGYFAQGFVENLWQWQLSDKTPYYGTIVWELLMLEAWHRVHMDGESLW
jgi:asparagine synthase (glutamine-hydrolysing)